MTATEPAPAPWQPTACILCECNCGIEIRLDGRRLARVRGDKAHPASKGYTCEKALRLDHYQNGRHRLTTPMRRRRDGSHEPIDWDTAIREVAARLADVRDTWGGETIFYYGGGGQGNHLCGSYGIATQRALGGKYRSSALAQEKTGEFWLDGKLYGGHTRGDFEHTEVAVFVGKNPWQSHGLTRARPTLKAIAADPARSMIVIDPRRSETADLADIHLAVKPGTDAWCLAAMVAVLVQDDLIDRGFIDEHVVGADRVLDAFRAVPVADYAASAGLTEEQVRLAARRIGTASSVAVYEDLGIQQAPNSVLCSYLEKLLWILTGSFAKPGGMHTHSALVDITSGGRDRGTSPVAGARVISGLVPCNVVCDEILTDHPDRYRAMIVESANPVSSLAEASRWRRALDELDTVVVVDVAMTETAMHADYVLPASSQFEKWEATFFTADFPENVFQLRPPLLDPLPGTLAEPEMHSRIIRELGVVSDDERATLSAAAADGRAAFAAAFFAAAADNPVVGKAASVVLYDTLGPTLPNGAAEAASLWAAAHKCAQRNAESIRRAGIPGEGLELGENLFEALLASERGVVFTVDDHADTWRYVSTLDNKIHVAVDEALAMLAELPDRPGRYTSGEYPFVLSAGERRSFTANAIYRDPAWRKRDPNGALRISPADATQLGLAEDSRVMVTTPGGSATATIEITDSMQPGHVSLPNGLGLHYPDEAGAQVQTGVAANELTTSGHRDPFAGTPFHKHVPARIEPL